jgi:hypothetical protein
VALELGRAISLAFSILSLYAVLDTAFFLPATRWEERLIASTARIGLAACICLISGLLFRYEAQPDGHSEPGARSIGHRNPRGKVQQEIPLTRTLPVRLLFWTLMGAALLFALAWSLDVYYVPLLWKNQPN